MFQITITVFREFLEITILLGLFGAAAHNLKNFKLLMASGMLIGSFGASVIAFFAQYISDSLDGVGSDIFDAVIILITVVMLCSTLVWMKFYSRKLRANINSVSEGIESGALSNVMLISLISSTIFREGSEIVLLIHSISMINHEEVFAYLYGFFIGASAGIIFGLSIYFSLFRFAKKYIFPISTFFMTFIAAGLAAEAARIFSNIGVIDIFGNRAWDTSWLVSDLSITGKILKAILGYSARPKVIEVLFYLGTILIIIILGKVFTSKKP